VIRFWELERLGVTVAVFSEGGELVEAGVGRGQSFWIQCGVSPDRVVRLRQVHGARVVCAIESQCVLPVADGMVTAVPGLPLVIFAADCVPVYLFDPVVRAAGLVHAGRAGTLLNICGEAVGALKAEFRCRPGDLHAVIGPSAGPCCYEVSSEIAAAFSEAGLPTRGRRVDLWQANARQLAAAGVVSEHITIAGLCTVCDGRFHSYRRTRGPQRNVALLML
jgi:YfiH family protein